MKKKFLERVMRERMVDTRKYRYLFATKNGKAEVIRLPLEDLDTTAALNDWETVWTGD